MGRTAQTILRGWTKFGLGTTFRSMTPLRSAIEGLLRERRATETLDQLVTRLREEEGANWDETVAAVQAAAGVAPSRQTLIDWYPELNRPPGPRPAAEIAA